MTIAQKQRIIREFSAMPWQPWLHRRFDPLVTYLIMVGGTRKIFRTQGIDGEFPLALYDTDDWYSTPEMFLLGGEEAKKYLQQKDIFVLTEQCENLLASCRARIQQMVQKPGDAREDFKRVIEMITPLNVYVWVAHGSEVYYHSNIREAARVYVPEEKLETFIGDISFPAKKNALALMEEDMHSGMSAELIHEKYSWIKARGGFRPGYTFPEIRAMQTETLEKPKEERQNPSIPSALKPLARQVQELVYLRTLRTDALWEVYHSAQPIFDRAAQVFGVASVKDYVPEDLLRGKTKPFPHAYAILKKHDKVIVTDSIIQPTATPNNLVVQGVVAHRGTAQGVVKILFTPQDIDKINEGDILVTNMTIPAYISAMRKAAAFVTNEGGITCHAAILAREMKKTLRYRHQNCHQNF